MKHTFKVGDKVRYKIDSRIANAPTFTVESLTSILGFPAIGLSAPFNPEGRHPEGNFDLVEAAPDPTYGRMTVRADEVQIGDRVSIFGNEVTVTKTHDAVILYSSNNEPRTYYPEASIVVDRPAPTVTITLPREVAQVLADRDTGIAGRDDLREACRKALGL